MIKLPREQLIVNTFRFAGRNAAGENIGYGSGFVARHNVAGKGTEYFLVTNRHVAEGNESSVCQIATPKGQFPHSCYLEGSTELETPRDKARGWFAHPKPEIDVAVYRLSQDPRFHNENLGSLEYATISTEIFASTRSEVDLSADVVFVGYPSGIIDTHNATPIFRKGSIASSPTLDWDGARHFLLDASVFPGSSGSPVFVLHDRDSMQFGSRQIAFLGLVTASMLFNNEGKLVARKVPVSASQAVSFQDFLNLGVVTKAACVLETITAALDGSAPLL